MPKARMQQMTIEGFVDPSNWNEDEEVVAVSIVADDSKEYVVENSGKGCQLLEYVDEYVKATGTVSKREGQHFITVQRFDVIDAPEIDEWEEEEDW
ncbi:hypothetical protein GGQ74_001967 [Desulfobaculum xiamenense]|uniref:Uncharacterized protein n=1 Tax=Desulfobaculum xiamenense TaxID=995050 RepID=A0A846QSZ4_9BACT|nr:hypothetical protein [Desulfobaculum xiamenense]NJB68294.1 hypothetical protein [Desulfobaculum xiamenense]